MSNSRLNHPQKELQRKTILCIECSVRECSVLKNCPREAIDLISDAKKIYHFVEGQRIIFEGNIDKGIYFVESGKIKIFKSDQKGQEFILRFAKPGQILGNSSANQENSVTAVAMTMTTLCFLDKEIFIQLARRFPEFAFDLIQYYSLELQQTDIRTMKLATLHVPGRVADALLTMYDAFGMDEENNRLNLELSRQEIANLAGTTKEQVSKVISELKDQGIINSKGRQINILQLDKLKKQVIT